MLSLLLKWVLFWLGFALFGAAISIALAYVAIGVCHTTKRERNGDHLKHTKTPAPPLADGALFYSHVARVTNANP